MSRVEIFTSQIDRQRDEAATSRAKPEATRASDVATPEQRRRRL